MHLCLLRLFLGFAALAGGISVVGMFASWPKAAEMLQGLGPNQSPILFQTLY